MIVFFLPLNKRIIIICWSELEYQNNPSKEKGKIQGKNEYLSQMWKVYFKPYIMHNIFLLFIFICPFHILLYFNGILACDSNFCILGILYCVLVQTQTGNFVFHTIAWFLNILFLQRAEGGFIPTWLIHNLKESTNTDYLCIVPERISDSYSYHATNGKNPLNRKEWKKLTVYSSKSY